MLYVQFQPQPSRIFRQLLLLFTVACKLPDPSELQWLAMLAQIN
jgi:hypothetical protein